MHRLTLATFTALLLTGPALCAPLAADDAEKPAPAKPADRTPPGYKLLYQQSFDDAAALKQFQFSDANAYRFTEKGKQGGGLELFQQAKYKTKVRSPFNLAMIAQKQFGSFILQADLAQTGREYGHRDMCVFFGFTDADKYYYVHIASTPDAHAHNVFIVNEQPRKAIAKIPDKGIKWGQDQWHTVRIERDIEVGTIKVFFDGAPIHETKDDTFKWGHIGFGSFDDTGKIDNIRIWGKEAKEVKRQLFPKQ